MAKYRGNKERFETQYLVDEKSGCWLWQGTMNWSGYGRFSVRVHGKEKKMAAHRMSYQGYVDWIPNGLHVLHTCDVRSCVNPDHLFLGTNADNMRDMALKGRSMRGEKQHLAKLTKEKVLEARRLYRDEGVPLQELCDRYEVVSSTMWEAINGITWKHI